MSHRFGAAIAVLVLLLVGGGIQACGGGGAEDHAARGEVLSVDADARRISIDHGDIPGLMKAMAMTFQVAPGVSLEGVSAGDRVEFRVKEEGGTYVVTALEPAGG